MLGVGADRSKTPTGADPHPAGRTFVKALVVTAAAIGLYLAWLIWAWGGAGTTKAVDDLGQMVAAFLAAILCWRRSHGDDHRHGWLLLGGSALSWAVREAVWSYYD